MPPMSPTRSWRSPARRRVTAGAGAILAALLVSGVVLAHPLGNFTINTYAGLRVSATEVRVDAVLDRAEIPTFQERQALDSDGDGELADAEIEAAREPECRTYAVSLELRVRDAIVPLELVAAGLSLPPGAGGLSTMRLVCELVGRLPAPIDGPTPIGFANRVLPERLGWREIVVEGDGVSVVAAEPSGATRLRSASPSRRLTAYPAELLATPLVEDAVALVARPGGRALPPFVASDAGPLPDAVAPPPATGSSTPAASAVAAVPGGITSGDLPEVFRATDPSIAMLLLAIVSAAGLGAFHALTPGHGKTLIAAYLVGTRGTFVHAAGLGLAVTVSHTLGILGLAVLVTAAQDVFAPDAVVRALPVVAALAFVAIGGWMVLGEVRRRRRRGAHPADHDHDHRHPHAPADDSPTVTWRSLFALGLAGGIVPSTSALLILLATVAAGRAGFGIVLVVGFGVGMGIVLTAIGVGLVGARGWLDRFAGRSPLRGLREATPLLAGLVVVVVGLWLTAQAIAGRVAL